MSFDTGFRWGYQHGQGHEQLERQRLSLLNAPPSKNDPHLLEPIRVRCLKPFYAGGKPLAVGDVVTLPRHDAESMIALRKAELAK